MAAESTQSGASAASREERLALALAECSDRLNAGETLDRAALLAAHPDMAGDLEAALEALDLAPAAAGEAGPSKLGKLGDYRLLRRVGRGGMGVVYEAWQESLERRVALKVLPAGLLADPRAVGRFLREARVAGKLQHPNVVPVFGLEVQSNTPYFVMDFIEGETLAQVIARRGSRGSAEPQASRGLLDGAEVDARYALDAAEAFAGAAEGLQHAHSKGVIHRDLKPSNLILDGEGRLRILDFGLARLEGQETLTLSGDLLGTPLYMSPEQARARRQPIDHRTDIYSLGATLYELLAGRPPFRGRDHQETLSQIIARDPPPLRGLEPRVPRDLETIVHKCLRKDPSDRYGTAEALAQDLRRFVRGDPIEARPQSGLERLARRLWRRRIGLLLSTAFAVSLAALAAFAWREHRAERWETYGRLVRGAVVKVQLRKATARVGWERNETSASLASYMARDPRVFWKAGSDPLEEAVRELGEAARLYPRLPDAWYHRARALELLGRKPEALADLGRALAAEPGFERARELEAAIAGGNAAGDGARNAAGDAPSPPPDAEPYLGASIEIRLERAVARLEERSYLEAVVELAGARGLWPELPEPALLLGKAFFLLDEEALAERAFREARRTAGGDAAAADRAAFEAAMFYLAQGKGQEALEWIEEVRDAAVRERSKSYIHFWKFQWREAIEAGHRAIAIDRGDSMAHAFLGFALHESGAIDEGLAMLERARELDVRNPYVPFTMGWILGCAGRIEAAREAYQAAVELDQGLRLAAHVDLIHVLGGQGRHDEAVDEGRMAAELAGPDDPRPLVSLASMLCDAERHDEVIAILEEALPLVPRVAYAHSVLALSLFAKGRIGEALAMHEKAASLPSMRTGGIHNHFGWSLLRAGRLAEAVKVLEKAMELFPELRYPHANLAEVHLRRGELEAAVEKYVRAIDCPEPTGKSHESLDYRLSLGDVLMRLGRPEEALEAWMEVVEVDAARRGAAGRIAALLRSGHDLEPETLRRLILLLQSRLDAGAQRPLALAALALAQLRFEGGMSRALAVLEKHSAIAPYAAIDLLLELAPREMVEAAAAGAASGGRLRYLQGRLLEQAGRHAEAARYFEAAAAVEEQEVEPLLRLAGCLRAAGRSPEAAARLRAALEGGFAAKGLLWTRWAAVSLADLGLGPGDLLRALPGGAGGEDLRWLLERLAAGEALRINCGGPEHAGAAGELWAADHFSTGGWAQGYLPVEVAGTEEAPLYQRQRLFAGHGPGPVGYRIPLPPGEYRVALHFAEVRFQAAGLRRFDVRLEENVVLEGYAPPVGAADVRTSDVFVAGGCLDLIFIPRLGEAAVAAIEVRRLE